MSANYTIVSSQVAGASQLPKALDDLSVKVNAWTVKGWKTQGSVQCIPIMDTSYKCEGSKTSGYTVFQSLTAY